MSMSIRRGIPDALPPDYRFVKGRAGAEPSWQQMRKPLPHFANARQGRGNVSCSFTVLPVSA